jgi:hypothetical protein
MLVALQIVQIRGPPNQPKRTTSGSAATAVDIELAKNTKTAESAAAKNLNARVDM